MVVVVVVVGVVVGSGPVADIVGFSVEDCCGGWAGILRARRIGDKRSFRRPKRRGCRRGSR